MGLGDDGATMALEGRPAGWLPFRGAASHAGRAGCCAVLRVLVAGERGRGRPGRGWGSVGGLVTSQGSVACLHLPLELVSGPGTRGWAAFCWLDRNFGFRWLLTVLSARGFLRRGEPLKCQSVFLLYRNFARSQSATSAAEN